MFLLRRARVLCAPEGDPAGGAGTGAPAPKPDPKPGASDGRTVEAILDEQARHGADIGRLKAHVGLDDVLEADGAGDPDDEDDDEESEGGVDEILSKGIDLGFGGDDEDDEPKPEKKKPKKGKSA